LTIAQNEIRAVNFQTDTLPTAWILE